MDVVTIIFEHEQAACDEAIHKLKHEMIVLMETTFKADFSSRILATFALFKDKLATVQHQLEFTSWGIDNRLSILEDKVAHLKYERAKTASLIATYADRLEHMDQYHAVLNQTISDLSISHKPFLKMPKRGAKIKEMVAEAEVTEKARARPRRQLATQEENSQTSQGIGQHVLLLSPLPLMLMFNKLNRLKLS